ncbi:DUF4389 domain-containing protein [Aestuariirhabdus sp. Z084]|uniref:DUF4389 domain-containing protein n=1 Tax=Aestuariirhabdus haliotis TaxID=2918751 RepID=UPI00201B3901|nr:DUF4389 domain-containing protein [Aestuariirhabdus haliotis]MCL6414521.1 DUF4389 domain-containing protein [Aestuariirhabdus haliotis]MCL6418497.1 DUF4389 domain-containing protein [Aestuariirhabdus haliotis]
MDESVKQHLKSESQWLRILFMLMFWVIMQVARLVVALVILVQLIFALITGSPNDNVLHFSKSLNCFIYQVLSFLTYNSDEKPFPFRDWPEG